MVDAVSRWRVDLCRGWQRVGQVVAGEFRGVERLNESGEWMLSTPAGSVRWGWLTDLDRGAGPDDVDSVRAVDASGRVRFGGLVLPSSTGQGGFVERQTSQGRVWEWSGPDLWAVLGSRVAFPDPGSEPPWSVSHDERSGVASSVAAAFIAANLGFAALSDRQVPGVQVVDGLVGSGEWSARCEPLDALVSRICEDAGIVCAPSVSFEGVVTFEFRPSADLSGRVVWSDGQDVAGFEVVRSPAAATWTVAGGQGEGIGRVLRSFSSGESGRARREQFSDQTALVSGSQVEQAARVSTLAAGESWSVSADAADGVIVDGFGSSVRIGDRVSVQVVGRRVVVPVTGARIEVSASRQQVTPVLGTAVPDALQGLRRDVAGLADRFRQAIA